MTIINVAILFLRCFPFSLFFSGKFLTNWFSSIVDVEKQLSTVAICIHFICFFALIVSAQTFRRIQALFKILLKCIDCKDY